VSVSLDDRDLKILQILSREGRISKTELARRVNLSATPCWERLRRLEESGLIRGYRADVDLARLSASVTVFVALELESHRADSFQTFERAIRDIEEVTACWAVGGGYDYLMQVVTHDINSYQRLIDRLLEARVGVQRYYTHVVTKAVKESGPPLAHLIAPKRD